MNYYCSNCGIVVVVLSNGDKIKPCSCESPIVATMEATTRGKGGLQSS